MVMTMRAAFRSLPGLAKFVRDEAGHILLYFTILLPVMLGFIGLSLEGGRLLMLNSQLQDLADAASLAGAKELDGTTGAIGRATAAANAMSQNNDPWWTFTANSGVQIDTTQTVFYSVLKGVPTVNDPNPPNDITTTSDTDASFIKVVTVTHSVAPAFLTAVGASAIGQTQATATAGSTMVACNVQPLMLCNPFEPNGKSFNTAVSDGTVKPGLMFHMKVKGNSTPGGDGNSFAPGDFGLLDPPGLDSSGANTIRNLLSQQSPNFCYINNVSPRTGQAVSKVSDGINVRFDMHINGNLTGLDQSPAPNVIKGIKPKNVNSPCNGQYDPAGTPPAFLPQDSNYQTYGNLLLGDGIVDVAAADNYWNYHYGSPWPNALKTAGQANRYLAYRLELALDGQTAPTPLVNTETRTPVCTAANAESVASRRIISVAVVDCLANNIHGNSVANVRSNAYANFFITQPSVDFSTPNFNSNGEVWGEFVEMITPSSGGGGKLHQVVQLYRDY
jgi:Flp pilus assembly protein TadG